MNQYLNIFLKPKEAFNEVPKEENSKKVVLKLLILSIITFGIYFINLILSLYVTHTGIRTSASDFLFSSVNIYFFYGFLYSLIVHILLYFVMVSILALLMMLILLLFRKKLSFWVCFKTGIITMFLLILYELLKVTLSFFNNHYLVYIVYLFYVYFLLIWSYGLFIVAKLSKKQLLMFLPILLLIILSFIVLSMKHVSSYANYSNFTAKIDGNIIFTDHDVMSVCSRPDCVIFDPNQDCISTLDSLWTCKYQFKITINEESATRIANATNNLLIMHGQNYEKLDRNIEFFVDDKKIGEEFISAKDQGIPMSTLYVIGTVEGEGKLTTIKNAYSDMQSLQYFLRERK